MAGCPGCGVVLPGPAQPPDPRSNASAACHALYGEVLGYEFQRLAQLGRWHQLLVDTYGAQHAGERTPAIATAFGLIGLCLALEHGRSGREVRDAHQLLARRYQDWPRFRVPAERAGTTIQDLALVGSPDEYQAVLQRWARDVWATWSHEHRRVGQLIRERLPSPG